MISFTFSQVSSVEPSSTTTISVQEPICGTRRKHSWIFPASLWQGMTTEQESGGRATRGRAAMYWTEETKQSMGTSGTTAFSKVPITGMRLGTGSVKPSSTMSKP